MVCLEVYKVVSGDKKIEDYRNTFANLALPLFAMAEPIAPKEFKYKDLKWTLWDRWTLEGDLTVQQVRSEGVGGLSQVHSALMLKYWFEIV
jgi:ubiquitin-activating enzyme E1